MINEVNSVVAHYRVVRGMPVTVNLDRAGQVAIIGDRKSVLCAARSMIVQLAALHAPDDVRIAAAFPREAAADWSRPRPAAACHRSGTLRRTGSRAPHRRVGGWSDQGAWAGSG